LIRFGWSDAISNQDEMMSTDNQFLAQRREKAAALADLGVKLYANTFQPSHRVAELLPKGEALQPEEKEAGGAVYRVAGRIMAMRKFGKAAFFCLADSSDRTQVYVRKDTIGDQSSRNGMWAISSASKATVQDQDRRTVAGGRLPADDHQVAAAPAGKFHGLTDVETRYRQRYLDLIVNPETREVFKKRVEIIRLIREFLSNRGYMEVETPMMQPVPGGATAKPFKTHHNALDMDLYLRIAPELYLKRLLVGGFEKVFEINRNFRNEGLSTRHNPEFTMLEFYQAYATYHDLMDLTEEMISWLAHEVTGSMDHLPGCAGQSGAPWRRLTMDESLVKIGGIDPALLRDDTAVMALARQKGINCSPTPVRARPRPNCSSCSSKKN
jgi:lysyl-tRNA synthetase, class II